MKRFFSVFVLIMTTCFLVSCTHLAAPTTFKSSSERPVSPYQLSHWRITGQVGAQTAKDSGSASLTWMQNGKQYIIFLSGPLGADAVKLTGSSRGVLLETSNGKRYTSTSAEDLLREHWGFNLPVSNLYYWVRGLTAPDLSYRVISKTQDQLIEFKQDGFIIHYLDFTQLDKLKLPVRMSLEGDQIKVKIIIKEWQV